MRALQGLQDRSPCRLSFRERNPGDEFTSAGLGVRGGWTGVGSTALEGPRSCWGHRAHNPEGQHKSRADRKCRNPRLVRSQHTRWGLTPTARGHLGELPSSGYLCLKCTFNSYNDPMRKVLLSLSPLSERKTEAQYSEITCLNQ